MGNSVKTTSMQGLIFPAEGSHYRNDRVKALTAGYIEKLRDVLKCAPEVSSRYATLHIYTTPRLTFWYVMVCQAAPGEVLKAARLQEKFISTGQEKGTLGPVCEVLWTGLAHHMVPSL